MEGSVLVGAVRERERERERLSLIQGILTGLTAIYRKIFSCAKWVRGKKVFD